LPGFILDLRLCLGYRGNCGSISGLENSKSTPYAFGFFDSIPSLAGFRKIRTVDAVNSIESIFIRTRSRLTFISIGNQTNQERAMAKPVSVISPATLHQQMREGGAPAHLVDVRSPAEYANGHAAGAVSIPIEEMDAAQLESRFGVNAGLAEPLHLICTSGLRAEQAARKLQAQGLHNLALVEGGTQAWSQQGLPLQRATVGVSLVRQTQIALGMLIVLLLAKGILLHPLFYVLTGLLGSGLIVSGLTARCGLAALLARMPWNRRPLGGSASSA
jgi:rhodanese-related sulfurtransferase